MKTFSDKRQSLVSLDFLNLFLLNIHLGVRPYLVVYLSSVLFWDAVQIGYVMGITGIIGIVAQAPAGALMDLTVHKRKWIALAALLIGCCSLATVWFSSFWSITTFQSISTSAGALFAPGLAALSLGIVGRKGMDERIGRNQTFTALGNILLAVLIGVCAHFYGPSWIYYLVAGMSVIASLSCLSIREKDIDHRLASGKEETKDFHQENNSSLFHRTTVVFLLSIVFFHFANAAMLPMLGQLLSRSSPLHASAYLSACIIVAQLVTVPLGVWVGGLSSRFPRRSLFLVAFVLLPIRGVLYTLYHDPFYLISIQVLDALCGTFSGVMQVMIAADITKGTGKFNLMQGIVATALGTGTALSHFLSGYLIQYIGFEKGFLVLSLLAVFALLFFYFAMPETKPHHPDNSLTTL